MKSNRTILSSIIVVFAFTFVPAMFNVNTVEASYRSQLMRLHNQERKKRNKPRFRRSGALNRAAVKYARVMNRNNHFSHTGPDGSSADDRMRAAGYRGRRTGENIAFGQRTAAEVFRGWMRSSGHRRNIRRRSFRKIGFGKSGTYWVTNFGS